MDAVRAEKDDPRITRIGRIIRKVRIDELPQAWSVLKGEMSFVGPRPERPQFVAQLAQGPADRRGPRLHPDDFLGPNRERPQRGQGFGRKLVQHMADYEEADRV